MTEKLLPLSKKRYAPAFTIYLVILESKADQNI